MNPILLIDFGSTFTKITAVDTDAAELLGTGESFTTVQSDINEGLKAALAELTRKIGRVEFVRQYACSSAAGGLRMVTAGLVPELTAEAAKQASLGAGAKVVKVYAYHLTEADLMEIESLHPDIFLLTGGIDGGNQECILHNAAALARIKNEFPIIIAGNRSCADQCAEILAGREIYLCENVMPRFNQINIEPVQNKIREVFLQRIIRAKGLSKASNLISGIVMPTPAAMLAALKLLADGCAGEAGIGELLGIDLGGATTDVYSIAQGMPDQINTVMKGLIEPYAKRTVEGDIGMRYSVHGIVGAAGIEKVSKLAGVSEERALHLVDYLAQNVDALPQNAELETLDHVLAALAVEIAVTRHVGKIEQTYTPVGLTYIQQGKDLRRIRQIVITGGAMIHARDPFDIAAHALYDQSQPMSLKPYSANILLDKNYILAAMGLLSQSYPAVAQKIMKKELLRNGN